MTHLLILVQKSQCWREVQIPSVLSECHWTVTISSEFWKAHVNSGHTVLKCSSDHELIVSRPVVLTLQQGPCHHGTRCVSLVLLNRPPYCDILAWQELHSCFFWIETVPPREKEDGGKTLRLKEAMKYMMLRKLPDSQTLPSSCESNKQLLGEETL